MSKKLIAANEQQGIPTPTTIPKHPILVNGINGSLKEKDSETLFIDGYAAASAYWHALLASNEAADGYFFYSNLREFVGSLPACQMPQFLDAVGELMVSWMVAGEPSDSYAFGPAHVEFTKLSHQDQDAQRDDNGNALTDLARAMDHESAVGGEE